MSWLIPSDWQKILLPDVPLLEIFLRGSIVYLSLFVMLRVVLKREAGTVNITDLLVIVLISDASQNAMAANYNSVPDGLLLVATLVFWAYALDWLGYRFPALGRWIHPPPLLLIRNGVVQRRNLRKELISLDELMSHLRQQGIEDVAEVHKAFIEGDGRISVIKREPDATAKAPDRRP